MRVFVAADPDEAARDFLERQTEILKNAAVRGNYTRRENLHITLRFIGEVCPSEVPALAAAVKKVCEGVPALRLEPGDPGYFGARPRAGASSGGRSSSMGGSFAGSSSTGGLFWYGLKENDSLAALRRLAGRIDHAVEEAGFGRADKPFTAHITLGREVVLAVPFEEYRRNARCEASASGTVPSENSRYLAVQQISLMESRRIRGVLTYLPLYGVYLPTAAADAAASDKFGGRP